MRVYAPILIFAFTLILLISCSKKLGKNRDLAYSDKALLDSCLNAAPYYYLNNTTILYPGNNGAHGTYKLRFNGIAFKTLTESGKLPLGNQMPEGSLIVKDVYETNGIKQYALMYKKSGAWLWAEIKPNKEIIYSVSKNPDLCVNCHNQSGNKDFILTFKFH